MAGVSSNRIVYYSSSSFSSRLQLWQVHAIILKKKPGRLILPCSLLPFHPVILLTQISFHHWRQNNAMQACFRAWWCVVDRNTSWVEGSWRFSAHSVFIALDFVQRQHFSVRCSIPTTQISWIHEEWRLGISITSKSSKTKILCFPFFDPSDRLEINTN